MLISAADHRIGARSAAQPQPADTPGQGEETKVHRTSNL
jgi:hypothetical protein